MLEVTPDKKPTPTAHKRTTGPEIWEDTDGKVDYVVALVGTGGTLAGLSRYFREKIRISRSLVPSRQRCPEEHRSIRILM